MLHVLQNGSMVDSTGHCNTCTPYFQAALNRREGAPCFTNSFRHRQAAGPPPGKHAVIPACGIRRLFCSVKKPPDPFSGRCNHTGGSGLKPTVAGRDAGVEATGMTSWRVGASLVRRAISCVLKQRLRSPPQKTFSPRDMPDTPERTVSRITFLPSVSIKASSFSPSPVISTV